MFVKRYPTTATGVVDRENFPKLDPGKQFTKFLRYRRLRCTLTLAFRSVFKLLRFAYRFQTLTVSVRVSHFFIPASCERNP